MSLVCSLVICAAASGCTCTTPEGAPTAAATMPPELSDAASLALFADWQALPVFGSGARRMQSSRDRDTGDKVEIPLWDRDNRDFNNFVCRSANADAPPSRPKHNFDLATCPEPYVRGVVLSRFEGGGRLVRIWMTAGSFRGAPPDREVLRIYVDDEPAPRVDVPVARALDGTAGEMFAPPWGAGSTRRMAWYYPVAFRSKLIVALDHLAGRDQYFHQTDVVLDQPRQAAAQRLAERDDALRVLKRDIPAAGTPRRSRVELAPGASAVVHELAGPATIVKLRLRIDREALPQLGEVTLRAAWDGEADAAIDVSLAELFAVVHGIPPKSSLALSAEDHGGMVELSLNLPMPFSKSAHMALRNGDDAAVAFDLIVETKRDVPKQAFGRLHVQRFETTKPAQEKTHPMANVTGRGRLVGTCLSMHGHGMLEPNRKRGHPMHFLEGDETAIIDGVEALSGTGTEDYFNGSFYFDDGPMGTPFAQVWALHRRLPDAPTEAQTTACRWHILGDAIDFASSLDLKMEIGPGMPQVLDDYRSVAFIYR